MLLHALLLAAAAGPCDAAGNQMELDQCWAAQAKTADTALNATYAKVTSGLRKLGVDPKPLVGIQLAWISARDKTCAFESGIYEGGSIAPMMSSECVARMTQARTQRLSDLLGVLQAEGAVAKEAPASPKVDADLNHFYGLLAKQLTAAQRSALTSSEVAWIAYRDKACAFERGSCLTELEQERIDELKAGWLGEQFW